SARDTRGRASLRTTTGNGRGADRLDESRAPEVDGPAPPGSRRRPAPRGSVTRERRPDLDSPEPGASENQDSLPHGRSVPREVLELGQDLLGQELHRAPPAGPVRALPVVAEHQHAAESAHRIVEGAEPAGDRVRASDDPAMLKQVVERDLLVLHLL